MPLARSFASFAATALSALFCLTSSGFSNDNEAINYFDDETKHKVTICGSDGEWSALINQISGDNPLWTEEQKTHFALIPNELQYSLAFLSLNISTYGDSSANRIKRAQDFISTYMSPIKGFIIHDISIPVAMSRYISMSDADLQNIKELAATFTNVINIGAKKASLKFPEKRIQLLLLSKKTSNKTKCNRHWTKKALFAYINSLAGFSINYKIQTPRKSKNKYALIKYFSTKKTRPFLESINAQEADALISALRNLISKRNEYTKSIDKESVTEFDSNDNFRDWINTVTNEKKVLIIDFFEDLTMRLMENKCVFLSPNDASRFLLSKASISSTDPSEIEKSLTISSNAISRLQSFSDSMLMVFDEHSINNFLSLNNNQQRRLKFAFLSSMLKKNMGQSISKIKKIEEITHKIYFLEAKKDFKRLQSAYKQIFDTLVDWHMNPPLIHCKRLANNLEEFESEQYLSNDDFINFLEAKHQAMQNEINAIRKDEETPRSVLNSFLSSLAIDE